MNRRTGRVLTGWDHVVQSLEDILTTRVLTRVMRRPYGSDAPKLIDAPMTDAVILALYVAVATAIAAWEPRFEMTEIGIEDADPEGRLALRLTGIYYPRGHLGDKTPDWHAGASLARITILLNERPGHV